MSDQTENEANFTITHIFAGWKFNIIVKKIDTMSGNQNLKLNCPSIVREFVNFDVEKG